MKAARRIARNLALIGLLAVPIGFAAQSAAEPASTPAMQSATSSAVSAVATDSDPAPAPAPRILGSPPARRAQGYARPPARYGFLGFRQGRLSPYGSVSQRGRAMPSQVIGEQVVGPMVIEEIEGELPLISEAACDDCGDVHSGGADCGIAIGLCSAPGPAGCLIPCPTFENTTFRAGVQGFKGPPNQGVDSSFGFHEGVNWGAPLWLLPASGVGMQLGVEAVQSNFSGSQLSTDTRSQVFVTGGLFHRVDCGLQAGVVIDYLYDDWDTRFDALQVRGEISWVYPCNHELGVWFTAAAGDESEADVAVETTDLYAFFYRYRFDDCGGGDFRLFGGASGASDGLLGGDVHVPMTDRLALEAAFTYLIPQESTGVSGSAAEVWNVGIALVWYPRCNSRSTSYYRPLISVANNGSMLIDQD